MINTLFSLLILYCVFRLFCKFTFIGKTIVVLFKIFGGITKELYYLALKGYKAIDSLNKKHCPVQKSNAKKSNVIDFKKAKVVKSHK